MATMDERRRRPGPAPAVLPAGLVRADEPIILAIKPSLAFLLLVSLPWLLWLAAGLLAAWGIEALGVFDLPLRPLAAVAVTLAVGRVIVAALQWLARIYVLTEARIIRVKGVLWVRVFECSLSRIQNTALSLPLAQRVLGVGTLHFATAGTAGMDATWLVISRPREVHEIVAECVRRAQGTAPVP